MVGATASQSRSGPEPGGGGVRGAAPVQVKNGSGDDGGWIGQIS